MRHILLVALTVALGGLAGCPLGTTGSSGECTRDPDCGRGEICARDSMCAASSSVRSISTTWTVRGATANDTTCASHPDLYISFIGRDSADTLGFAPVPCKLGQFMVDKLPDRFRQVELGVEGGAFEVRAIGTGSTVMIDLR